jgi:hypothetical protein
MRIAVCGCSWSSRDPHQPNFEFGQVVADYYGAEYKNYAVPGCSNFVIALQIEQSLIDFDPDLVIINATTVTRDDFKILSSDTRYDHTKLLNSLGDTLYSNSMGSMFDDDLRKSLDDIYDKNLSQVFASQSKHDLYKKWFLTFYDADINKHKQYYQLQCMLYKLQSMQKSVVFSANTFEWTESYDLKTHDESKNFADTKHVWDIPDKFMLRRGISDTLDISDLIYGSWENSPGTIMSNHLAPACHQDYASHVINHINRYKLINNTVI